MPRLDFESPIYLIFLVFLPVLAWFGWQHFAALGNLRRVLAIAIRMIVWTVIVFAVAGVQWVRTDDRVTVMYLLDQSDSVPAAKRRVMLDYVIQNVKRHRDATRGDKAGIIAFGRDAAIEIPPYEDEIPPIRRLEALGERRDATNLESALNLAQASMPEDTARRIVIVTDGNENVGAANRLAARLASAGVGIDVVPVVLQGGSEILVEKVDLPTNIRKGQPFEARVVVERIGEAAKGRLRLKQKVDGRETLLLEETVTLDRGKNVFPLRHEIDQPGAFVYDAEFVPDDKADDAMSQNNAATAYTYVRGKGRVLVIVDHRNPSEYNLLVDTLREANIEAIVQPSNALFGTLAELQAYDAVILAGVPRVSGDDENGIASFSDEQIEMLVRNTEQLGAGLLMIGGRESFGAGGWTGTKIEEAMPVDFQIKNEKVRAVGALALIMHASEMAQGNYWQKVIGKAAIEQLGPADYAGVLHWSMRGDEWMWGGGLLKVGPNKRAMLAALNRMTPGDMPQFDPAMKMAVAGLRKTPAAVKHCIIISDGDPVDPSPATIRGFKSNNITISTVAVASHGAIDTSRLQRIATATSGKFYKVQSGRALPRIFQLEARRVSKPLVLDIPGGASPQVTFPHPLLDGIEQDLPPITGLVMTQTKDSSLPQVLIRSPKPDSPENSTVLAVWNYGLGRTAALTTDAGARWASSWVEWDGYEKFYSQLVRWLMRPTGDTGQYTIATQNRDGEVQVVVNALSGDDEFLNFLDMDATVLGPDLKPIPLRMAQTAPGRYVGTFDSDRSGNYFVNVIPKAGETPLSTGVTVPYSDEYRIRESNLSLIESLASVTPVGGSSGMVAPEIKARIDDELLQSNAFRDGVAPARSIRDAWHWFVLGGCVLFLSDIFVRRVAINLTWVPNLVRRMRGDQSKVTKTTARLDTLKKAKSEATREADQRRSQSRFAVSDDPEGVDDSVDNMLREDAKPTNMPAPEKKEESTAKSYTERLLEAKRKAGK